MLNQQGCYSENMYKDTVPEQNTLHRLLPNNYYNYDVDHIDRNRTNNKLCNLRHATRSQNSMNRTKGTTRQATSQYKYFDNPITFETFWK